MWAGAAPGFTYTYNPASGGRVWFDFLLALVAPAQYFPVSFDAGGLTTGPLVIPFILSLGVGVASVLRGGDAAAEGFGGIGLYRSRSGGAAAGGITVEKYSGFSQLIRCWRWSGFCAPGRLFCLLPILDFPEVIAGSVCQYA